MKHTLALAAATLCTFAQAQNVSVYGKLYPYVSSEKGTGAAAAGTPVSTLTPTKYVTGVNGQPQLTTMQAGNSNLGFRGSEDLGGGLKAIFQLETLVGVDDGSTDPKGFWARNTFVGLSGDFGTVRLGKMDTIYKNYGDTIGFLGISSGTFMSNSDVTRKTGFANSASSFHLRRNNSIQYETPEVKGFQAGMQWSSDEAKVTTDAGSSDPRVYSFGIQWDGGPVYLGLAHEIHYDMFGGGPKELKGAKQLNSRDSATQFAVEWRITRDQRLEFDLIQKEYKNSGGVAGNFESFKNTSFLLAYSGRFATVWRVDAALSRANAGSCRLVGGATCSTGGLAATKLTVGTGYNLSKRTMLFAAYDTIRNGNSGRFSNTTNAVSPGEDVRHLAAGVSHSF